MPVGGRKPKPEGQAVTRHKQRYDWTEVDDTPFSGGRRLPRQRVNGQPWMKATKDKWTAWSSMPHCVLWSDSEWEFALDTIELAAQFHAGDHRVATELRNRERVLGTTHDFRRDLRIKYVTPKVDTDHPADVAVMDDYRDL